MALMPLPKAWPSTAVNTQDDGFGDQTAKLRMILKNKQGQTNERSMTVKTLEVPGDGDKSSTIFHNPRDVKGTAFLSLPTKLAPMTNGSVASVGSNVLLAKINLALLLVVVPLKISFVEVEKYTNYTFIKEDTLDGETCL